MKIAYARNESLLWLKAAKLKKKTVVRCFHIRIMVVEIMLQLEYGRLGHKDGLM